MTAFAVLVIVPMGLRLGASPARSGRHALPWRTAVFLQPIGAIALLVSLAQGPGWIAGWLALPWLATCVAASLFGVWRFLPRPAQVAEEICLDAALLCLPVGAAWLVAERFGWAPFGFGGTVARLTAIHFHYAGFALLTFAAMTGRALPPSDCAVFRICAGCLLTGIPLVAAGIVQSRHGISTLSLAATALLTVGVWLLGFLACTRVAGRQRGPVRVLLALASVAGAVAMGLALLYAIGGKFGLPAIAMPMMWQTHGLLQAFGFCFGGLFAWRLATPPGKLPPPGVPFSRLSSGGIIGPDYFARSGALDESGKQAGGIVDSLDEFRRSDFDPREVAPTIRAFYERTNAHELFVRPDWKPGFRWIGRRLHALGARLGQMRFPIAAESEADLIQSRIVPVRDGVDGRCNVRGWVRTYAQTGQAMYVAAYATHRVGAETFMNIAFPMPLGNLTSILRLRAEGSSLVLTTLQSASAPGDQGVFFANALCPVRLPIDETIHVWPAEHAPHEVCKGLEGVVSVIARHEMWFCGMAFLTLEYAIQPPARGAD